jgi:hypothetical protein
VVVKGLKEFTKIRWAPPLRPSLLKRLYDSDAAGFQDMALCDEVGITLFVRCRTFALVSRNEVECPDCGTVFSVSSTGESHCQRDDCEWQTTHTKYRQSIRNYNAHTGRALHAFLIYYHRYPNARTYKEKILLIDHLIHSFHINEKTGVEVKSGASKLFEGNKKAVVRFLDDLSAIHPQGKEKWRRTVAGTIDRRIVRENVSDEE